MPAALVPVPASAPAAPEPFRLALHVYLPPAFVLPALFGGGGSS